MQSVAEPQSADAPATVMNPLHPSHLWVLRIRGLILLVPLLVVATVAGVALGEVGVPIGLVPGATALIGLALLLVLPNRRHRAWGWREEEDELHVRNGVLIRTYTIVPFGRVQHIDIAQGPIERPLGLATLIVHTAGTRGASVPLPGLARDQAEAMRDRIRGKIRQELA